MYGRLFSRGLGGGRVKPCDTFLFLFLDLRAEENDQKMAKCVCVCVGGKWGGEQRAVGLGERVGGRVRLCVRVTSEWESCGKGKWREGREAVCAIQPSNSEISKSRLSGRHYLSIWFEQEHCSRRNIEGKMPKFEVLTQSVSRVTGCVFGGTERGTP